MGNSYVGCVMVTRTSYNGWVMILMKNMKYSRWVDDDDNEEHEVLRMGW
jgi:hypothetical protein